MDHQKNSIRQTQNLTEIACKENTYFSHKTLTNQINIKKRNNDGCFIAFGFIYLSSKLK
jgi:hypothetical protein